MRPAFKASARLLASNSLLPIQCPVFDRRKSSQAPIAPKGGSSGRTGKIPQLGRTSASSVSFEVPKFVTPFRLCQSARRENAISASGTIKPVSLLRTKAVAAAPQHQGRPWRKKYKDKRHQSAANRSNCASMLWIPNGGHIALKTAATQAARREPESRRARAKIAASVAAPIPSIATRVAGIWKPNSAQTPARYNISSGGCTLGNVERGIRERERSRSWAAGTK